MNELAALLGADDVVVDVDAPNREQLLRVAASLIAARHAMSPRAIEDALMTRERLGSTALGHGIALPHARITGLDDAAAAFLRTRTPIAFDAPDGKPVSQFLVLIVPAHATEHHLRLLACAATMFANRAFRDALKGAATPAGIGSLFAQWQVEPAQPETRPS